MTEQKNVDCPSCGGCGESPAVNAWTCWLCGGQGVVTKESADKFKDEAFRQVAADPEPQSPNDVKEKG